jgi:hypothetical protein
VRVPLIAADLIPRRAGPSARQEGVKADTGAWERLADRLLIAAGHVDRDGLDRVAALAEQLEELVQGFGVATGRGPHDPAAMMIDDAGQVAVVAP